MLNDRKTNAEKQKPKGQLPFATFPENTLDWTGSSHAIDRQRVSSFHHHGNHPKGTQTTIEL
jgi:hypothetical protein